MKKFISIRSSKLCRVGQMMVAEEVGEPLFFCDLQQRLGHLVLRQTSLVGVPFEQLAFDIIELGVQIPLRKPILHPTESIEEKRELERTMGDVIDDEVEKRIRTAEPSYKEKSGIVVPKGINNAKGTESTGGGQ